MLKEYRSILSWHRFLASKALALSILSSLMEGAAILLLIPILGQSLGHSSPKLDQIQLLLKLAPSDIVWLGIGAFCALGLASTLARYLAEKLCLSLRSKTEETARLRMGHAIADMDWAHFHSLQLGAVGQSIMTDPSQIGAGAFNFVKGITALITAALFLCITFTVSTSNTLLTLAFAGVSLGCLRLFNTQTSALSNKVSSLSEQLQIKSRDLFDNLKFFRSTGRLSAMRGETDNLTRQFASSYVLCHSYGQAIRSLLESGGIVYIALFLLFNLAMGHMPLPEALVFLGIFYRTVPRLLQAQENFYHAKAYLAWYASWSNRLSQALSHPMEHGGTTPPAATGRLEVAQMHFTYPGQQTPTLHDINFSLAPGETVAIVGPSGGGKSTLLDIITGLLPHAEGDVLLYGVALGVLDRENWQRRIGLVQQDSPIFHGTVLDNICWGEGTPDLERAKLALSQADAWEFVQDLSNGLGTQVGEKGGRLSGGQRQRIALARALYRNPALLLLDEPTSSLDASSEHEILKALTRIKGQVSMIIVTHRLRAARLADRILLLDAGRIVEQGTWEALLADTEGTFAQLAKRQGLTPETHLLP